MPATHVLIDATNGAAIASSSEYGALAGLSVIQYANTDVAIVPLNQNKGFSQFEHGQLLKVAASIGLTLKSSVAYPDLLKKVREGILAAEWLVFPFTKEQVDNQVATLDPDFDKPMYFNPDGAAPILAQEWQASPQRNRKRSDASYWIHYASGWLKTATGSAGEGRDAAPPPPAAPPGKRPSAPAAASPASGGTTPAPKPRAAPSGPAKRPKAGSNAERVWLIADEVFAANPKEQRGSNSLRSLVVEKCKAQDINFATAYDQYKKWSTAV